MIQVDRQAFMDEGYVIVREIIRPDRLEPLRQSTEKVVHRAWPDGIPKAAFQPRVHGFSRHIDESNAGLAKLIYAENVLDVMRQLMRVDDVGLAGDYLMCNPVEDHGPWFWRRDFSPVTEGPLQGSEIDFAANGPNYLQWNIPLYDDDVLWVVPGSHRRANTDQENRQMGAVPHGYAHGQQPQGEKRHEPLPGSLCVALKAGDGVVYTNRLLHWGSNYSSKLRRCIHLGYRALGSQSNYHQGYQRDFPAAEQLSTPQRAYLARLALLYDRECDATEAVLRAILDRDEASFHEGMAKLHPGKTGRFSALIHLCKRAGAIRHGKDPEYGRRFTQDEAEMLGRRFAALDQALQTEAKQYMPGLLLAEPTCYRQYDLPPQFAMAEFVASWKN